VLRFRPAAEFWVRQVSVREEMMNLIRNLWRGDIPLVKTYWLFGVIAGIFFNIVFAYIEYQSTVFSKGFGPMFVLGLVVFVFTYSVFISFAIWRSANKYQGIQRYVILAKIAVILGMMALIKAVLEIFGVVPPA
jgi:hypothetical protein